MTHAKYPVTWVLAADGGGMRVWECRDWQDRLRELPEFSADSLASHGFSHDLKSDKPGRAFSTGGGQRAAVEPHTDPHDRAKQQFAELAAGVIDDSFRQGRFERLVIAAPPKTLGALRDALSPQVRAVVLGEIDKDFLKSDVAQISAAVDPFLHLLKD